MSKMHSAVPIDRSMANVLFRGMRDEGEEDEDEKNDNEEEGEEEREGYSE